jgi:uncharacterized protein (DUF2345 family)
VVVSAEVLTFASSGGSVTLQGDAGVTLSSAQSDVVVEAYQSVSMIAETGELSMLSAGSITLESDGQFEANAAGDMTFTAASGTLTAIGTTGLSFQAAGPMEIRSVGTASACASVDVSLPTA